jgi:hypothetical protein
MLHGGGGFVRFGRMFLRGSFLVVAVFVRQFPNFMTLAGKEED